MAGRGRRGRGGKKWSQTQRCTATRIKNDLFVDNGVPSSLSSFAGTNAIRYRQSQSRTGKHEVRQSNPNFFGYVYPDVEYQDTRAGANVEDMACRETQTIAFDYSYGSSFILGESSSRGLGFHDESDMSEGGTYSSFQKKDHYEEGFSACIPVKEETDCDEICLQAEPNQVEAIAFDLGEEPECHKTYPRNNSAFISIGGMKLFTQDISDGENAIANDYSLDASSSEDPESSEVECSESATSKDDFGSDSDIDADLLNDYLEGIGGRDNLLDAKWLLENDLNDTEGDSTSNSSFDETIQRLGGIALQEASREYGMHTPTSRRLHSTLSSSLIDLIPSAKKRHGQQPWPKGITRSKGYTRVPGARKKHRKETINVKRRERMLNRGVDLKKINTKMEKIVLNKVDIFSFEPMHPRDCSQLRRLAAIYRLQSGCQSAGKKRFVTVTRTPNTCMPSASDKIRLDKLIGSDDDDFAVNDPSTPRLLKFNKSGGPSTEESQSRNKGSRQAHSRRKGHSSQKRSSQYNLMEKERMIFVSSGTMQSESEEITKIETSELRNAVAGTSTKVGAFELHTKGFGSKMMTKMGYIEGGGLGKAGQGMAEPIGVVQRPKSLGLGFDLATSKDDLEERKPRKENVVRHPEINSFGAFEKHTKGFGSKIMKQMGFVEGMGLGRDAQGITNPLAAVRRPKARGLGA